MHLMSRPHLAAASGIVGAPGPLACGFGLAAKYAGEGRVALAFFGDGAVNEGMLMEALNLAAVWRLPVVFVCKDNGWAVSTRSAVQTGGGLRRRLAAFGMPVVRVDGADVARVDVAAGRAVSRARTGGGPSVLLARCARLEGHFLGDPLVRVTSAVGELAAEVRSLLAPARAKPGAPAAERLDALLAISRRAAIPAMQLARRGRDPLPRAGRRLPAEVATGLEARARAEVAQAEARALREAGVGA
ncbi:MAG: thiamine pyrophosphate-dependent enzyme, partial [Actinomycetes bacterium]